MLNPSKLHEYAVGWLWELLNHSNRPVLIKDDAGRIHDLREGMATVEFPTVLQPIQGCVPDLAIFNEDRRVVTIVEIIVTSAPDPGKQAKLDAISKQGVNVIVKTIPNWDALRYIVETPSEIYWGEQRPIGHLLPARWRQDYGGNAIRVRKGQHPREAEMALQTLAQFIKGVVHATPEMRRDLLDVLKGLDSPESLYALSPSNPKRDDEGNG